MNQTIGIIISAAALLCTVIVQLARIANRYGKMETKLETVTEAQEKMAQRISDSERSIINLKTDTASISVMLSQMGNTVEKLDKKIDRILEKV